MDVASIVDASERRFPCDTGGPALLCLYFPGGRRERGPSSVVVVSVGSTEVRRGSQVAHGGRAGCPRSSLALGSRSLGGPAEDARDSTAIMPVLNGVPAAGWMDGSYTFPFESRDLTPDCVLFLRSKNATLGGEDDSRLD